MSTIVRLPGLIDIHVHLRDPGQTHKEDFYSGTCAAVAGGVTTVFDMPNNKDPILTYQRLSKKLEAVKKKAVCDYGFYFGTDGKNTAEFEKVGHKVVGLKVYLNATTGKLVIEDVQLVEKVLQVWPKNKIIVIHAEGEKVDLALQLCARYGNKIHITHIATKVDLEKIIAAKKKRLPVNCDVTPHHLFLYKEKANNILNWTLGREAIEYNISKMIVVKPSIAYREDVEFLWEHLKDIDCIATDHAPHTVEEKESSDPPSGLPGLETMLPLLLTAVKQKRITIEDIIRLTNKNPQKIFDIKQDSETYIEVDADEDYIIDNNKLYTKCGWSPFAGRKVIGRVKKVFIRGEKFFEADKVWKKPGFGRNVMG